MKMTVGIAIKYLMFEECISTAGKIDKMLLVHNSPFISVNVDKFFNLFCRGHVSGVFVIMFRWFSFLQSDENVAVSVFDITKTSPSFVSSDGVNDF